MGKLRLLYCRHCEQTCTTDAVDKCALCGRVGGLVAPEAAHAAAAPPESASETAAADVAPAPPEPTPRRLGPLFFGLILTLMLLALGLAPLMVPVKKEEPKPPAMPKMPFGHPPMPGGDGDQGPDSP